MERQILHFKYALALTNGAIKLSHYGYASSSYYYGTMRVYYNNRWVNICDDYSYSSTETNVICHQLGYTRAWSYSRAGLVRLELCNKEALHHFCLGGTEHFMMDGMLLSRMLVSIVLLVEPRISTSSNH